MNTNISMNMNIRDQWDSRSRPFSWSLSRKCTFSWSQSQSRIFVNKSLGLGLTCWYFISSVSVLLVETVPAQSRSRTLKTGLAYIFKFWTIFESFWKKFKDWQTDIQNGPMRVTSFDLKINSIKKSWGSYDCRLWNKASLRSFVNDFVCWSIGLSLIYTVFRYTEVK